MKHECNDPCLYCMVTQLYEKIEQLKKGNIILSSRHLRLKKKYEELKKKKKK